MAKHLFTSESVTEGHPDKVCDQISDAILDEILAHDPNGRVACETTATTGLVFVMGEITTSSYVDVPKVVRRVLADIGYVGIDSGFDSSACSVITSIDEQSRDIAFGVNKSIEQRIGVRNLGADNCTGAGDQGMMFGFACDETKEYMPLPISLAHKLTKKLTEVRKNNILPYLRPDGKSQVTIQYDDGKPIFVDTIVISSQHIADAEQEQIKKDIIEHVIKSVVPTDLINNETKYFINPTGRFVIGGPQGDAGLTGRKIIVDTYGGYSRHGGGAFSGKDPTKVDRSAAYMARYIAKNIVASGLAKKCELQISYAIGVANPVSVMVDTFGTGKIADEQISEIIQKLFDMCPDAIIKMLDLRKPIYRKLAAYGHMGREDLGVTWEKLDKVKDIKSIGKEEYGCDLN